MNRYDCTHLLVRRPQNVLILGNVAIGKTYSVIKYITEYLDKTYKDAIGIFAVPSKYFITPSLVDYYLSIMNKYYSKNIIYNSDYNAFVDKETNKVIFYFFILREHSVDSFLNYCDFLKHIDILHKDKEYFVIYDDISTRSYSSVLPCRDNVTNIFIGNYEKNPDFNFIDNTRINGMAFENFVGYLIGKDKHENTFVIEHIGEINNGL